MELHEQNIIVNENFRSSAEKFYDQFHPDVIRMKQSTNSVDSEKKGNEAPKEQPPTSYTETLMHLFKGNVGPGCFASENQVNSNTTPFNKSQYFQWLMQ
jgi:hypothetical protein